MSPGAAAALDAPPGPKPPSPWLVLVVDDEPEMHAVTRLCFRDFEFDGRALHILSALSAAEARELLKQQPGIALVLLDVVMESEHAGLDLARYIREELRNDSIRIVLRTGQAGQAPARDIVRRYQIDDYCTKTELTAERLYIVAMSALRTYELLCALEARERTLAQYGDEIERFAQAASHDLQAPLHAILQFAQRLQEKYQPQLSGEGQQYLYHMVQNARDTLRMIEDLLEYTRIGRGGAGPEPVSLDRTVQQACTQLQAEFDIRRAAIDCGALPTVSGHPELLQELFRQLIDNAIKFQPGARPVVSIAAVPSGDNWEIRVSDRGIGMEPQLVAKLFEPRGGLQASGDTPVHGIGLAICRKIAQLHGGSIRAQSVAGTGTTLVVTLPASR